MDSITADKRDLMDNSYCSSGTYTQLGIEEDIRDTYEIVEQGRKVQFHKGKHGKRIITDFGRDPHDLIKAFSLLGNNVVQFDNARKVVPRKRDNGVVSVTKIALSVTQSNVSVTCEVCGTLFTPQRASAKYCSPLCRKKASRS